jgi:hypothetical protein
VTEEDVRKAKEVLERAKRQKMIPSDYIGVSL